MILLLILKSFFQAKIQEILSDIIQIIFRQLVLLIGLYAVEKHDYTYFILMLDRSKLN